MSRKSKIQIGVVIVASLALFIYVKVLLRNDAQEKDAIIARKDREAFKNDSVARYTDSILNAVPEGQKDELEARKREYTAKMEKAKASIIGKWEIKVQGYYGKDVEMVGFDEQMHAVWVYATASGNSTKRGSWELINPTTFKFSIRGNTGIISETYKKDKGVWRSGKNYLERYIP